MSETVQIFVSLAWEVGWFDTEVPARTRTVAAPKMTYCMRSQHCCAQATPLPLLPLPLTEGNFSILILHLAHQPRYDIMLSPWERGVETLPVKYKRQRQQAEQTTHRFHPNTSKDPTKGKRTCCRGQTVVFIRIIEYVYAQPGRTNEQHNYNY